MLTNTYLWSAIGLVIFFGVLVKFGVHNTILKALDARGEKVAAELAEAKKLREDAQKLLAEYEAKRKAAEAEAEAIIAAARDEAERLARDADVKMADFVTRRTKAAELKIAQAEAQATADVRAAAADAAAKAAEQLLRGQMTGKAGADMLARSLGDIKGKLN
ncbi:MAG: ATP F0F1 synthase subunit B [Hyphomicrobiales bacterium]|jgi:F-type H+-transporting ATPase subunit b|nr:ATP F0F1 synthase subunit B [Hyphomicrobiales bacterium]